MNQAVRIDASAKKAGGRNQRLPIVRCPVCNTRAMTRTSDEISPETRRLYYACSNFECAMTWTALLSFEKIVSPSGVSPTFRSAQFREGKPPGRDFGQESLPGIVPSATSPPMA